MIRLWKKLPKTDTILQEHVFDNTAAIEKLMLALPTKQQPVVFLDYKKSIEKLEDIVKRLGIEIEAQKTNFTAWYAAQSLFLALLAQIKTLEALNDDTVNAPLSWDTNSGLPSHPSLIADAQKYVELAGESLSCAANGWTIASILNSFAGWVAFSKETSECFCGRTISSTPRRITRCIMIHNAFKADSDNGLSLKQCVGVQTDDEDHLQYHYKDDGFHKPSKKKNDILIIYETENVISVDTDRVRVNTASCKVSNLFKLPEFIQSIPFGLLP